MEKITDSKKIEEILKRDGLINIFGKNLPKEIRVLSKEESYAITSRINKKMEEVDREFRYRQAKSAEWAARTYVF